jgi:hypothetical protein
MGFIQLVLVEDEDQVLERNQLSMFLHPANAHEKPCSFEVVPMSEVGANLTRFQQRARYI